ncbi:MAG: hypothetical protein WDM76_08435 [Limisphaerales bacterium]
MDRRHRRRGYYHWPIALRLRGRQTEIGLAAANKTALFKSISGVEFSQNGVKLMHLAD